MTTKQIFNTSAELDYPTVLPTLDLDFANTKTLDPRITFTRSSGGSYVGADGLIKYAGVNEPRFDHNPLTGESLGLLVEDQRTNVLLNSATLSTQSVTVAAVGYTLHFTGTGTVTLSGTSTAGPLVGTGTGEANRVSLTFTPTAGSLTLTVSGTVSNAQLEAGIFPTSYIPTTAATVTRAGDVANITGSNFSSFFIQNTGTIYADCSILSPATFSAILIAGVYSTASGSFRFLSRRSNQGARNTSPSDLIEVTSTVWNGERKKIAGTWVPNDCALADNGTLVAVDTSTVSPLSIVDGMSIGTNFVGGHGSGSIIARIVYWPTRLSNTTLQAITQP